MSELRLNSPGFCCTAGLLAAVLFWSALFVFAALEPGFSHYHSAISELGAFNAPNALAWNVIGFVLPGMLLAACGAGIGIVVDGRRSLLFWLLTVSGAGFASIGLLPVEMEAGVTRMDSAWSFAHVLVAHVCGGLWVVGALLLWLKAARRPEIQHLAPICLALALLASAGLVFYFVAGHTEPLAAAPGLVHRVAFAVYFSWYAMAGLLLSPQYFLRPGR